LSGETFLISELAQKSGVSARTIRYYIAEDLLPAPPVEGRYSRFSSDYIDRILLIRYLQETYLPLKEIRRQMQNLSITEVRELLQKYKIPAESESSKPSSAMAYTNAVISSPQPKTEPGSALEYVSSLLKSRKISEKMDDGKNNLQYLTQRPSPPEPAVRRTSPILERGENWRRIQLAPGLELHVEQHLMHRYETQIRQMIDLANNLFRI